MFPLLAPGMIALGVIAAHAGRAGRALVATAVVANGLLFWLGAPPGGGWTGGIRVVEGEALFRALRTESPASPKERSEASGSATDAEATRVLSGRLAHELGFVVIEGCAGSIVVARCSFLPEASGGSPGRRRLTPPVPAASYGCRRKPRARPRDTCESWLSGGRWTKPSGEAGSGEGGTLSVRLNLAPVTARMTFFFKKKKTRILRRLNLAPVRREMV